VIVTHHIEEIPVGTTHALLLKEGAIAVSGPVQQVVTSEHITAVFGVDVGVSFDGSRFYARASS
jgi:iron complex transport system ATP-binding protein